MKKTNLNNACLAVEKLIALVEDGVDKKKDNRNIKLYAIAYNRLRNETDVEDAIMETFARIWEQGVDKLNGIKNIEGYIVSSLINTCTSRHYDKKRKQYFPQALTEENAIPDQGFIIEEKLIIEEKDAKIMQLIDQLPKAQQEVVTRIIAGYSHKEIAEELGITVTTSTSRMDRAQKKTSDDAPSER